MVKKRAPELTFQDHITAFLVRVHGYALLKQSEITDTEHCIAEDHLWSFLTDTQADTLKRLAEDYGSDARGAVFRALRSELTHTPLWVLIRHGLPVRGLTIRLYYRKPRSSESDAVQHHPTNRIDFRPHYYFDDKHQEIDCVLFLNGLPIVDLEVKLESGGWRPAREAGVSCPAGADRRCPRALRLRLRMRRCRKATRPRPDDPDRPR